MLNAGLRDQFPRWRHSRRRRSVCSVLRCPDLRLQSSMSFVHGLKKTPLKNNVFFKLCTKLTLHSNHRSGHLKTEHTERLLLLWRVSTQKTFSCCDTILETGPMAHSKHEKWTAGSAWETWTVPAADSVCCACVGWEINLLITSETAPFFCVCLVYTLVSS
jgi:hypothetical protein